jgi:CheY-like chemotaxis protein
MSDTPSAGPRILIVDDHPANRLAFGTILENAGYSVHLARSGPEGIECAQREPFALILLDVRMPTMDGFEVTACLRQRDGTRDIPIILMSAYDRTPAQISKGYQAGASDYLFNPIDEDVLRSKVAAFLSVHQKNARLKDQVRLLTATVESLRAEIAELRPARAGLRARVDQLNEVIASVQLELEQGTPR